MFPGGIERGLRNEINNGLTYNALSHFIIIINIVKMVKLLNIYIIFSERVLLRCWQWSILLQQM